MEKISYFDLPTQVKFADPDNVGHWVTGIAYHNEIICACCGGIFNIDEVYENSAVKNAIYPYSDWVDISDSIDNGDSPKDWVGILKQMKL